jgi:hypothetical protein
MLMVVESEVRPVMSVLYPDAQVKPMGSASSSQLLILVSRIDLCPLWLLRAFLAVQWLGSSS